MSKPTDPVYLVTWLIKNPYAHHPGAKPHFPARKRYMTRDAMLSRVWMQTKGSKAASTVPGSVRVYVSPRLEFTPHAIPEHGVGVGPVGDGSLSDITSSPQASDIAPDQQKCTCGGWSGHAEECPLFVFEPEPMKATIYLDAEAL